MPPHASAIPSHQPAAVPSPAPGSAYSTTHMNAAPPAALRSASDNASAATRRRNEEVSRAQAGIDTFDVIESSLPGSGSDPWDRDAAEALTGLYESGATGFPSHAAITGQLHADTHAATPSFAAMPMQAAVPGVDHLWLE
ncbi:MAG: hypothetical protein ABL893_15195, partial [Hyphomicrobium sp.]